MRNNLKQENMWIVLFWIFIFMVLLVWDQEKIVLLNLVLFCYFLYFMGGSAINESLQNKANLIRVSLFHDINLKLNTLTSLVQTSSTFVLSITTILLTLLKKINIIVLNLINTLTKFNSSYRNSVMFLFPVINLLMMTYNPVVLNFISHQYLFVSNFVTILYNSESIATRLSEEVKIY